MAPPSALDDQVQRLRKLNPFHHNDEQESGDASDEEGAQMTDARVAGGRAVGGAHDIEERKKLHVSKALRRFLADAGQIHKKDIGGNDDEETVHSHAVQAILARPQVDNPPYVNDRSFALSEYFISSSHNTYLVGHQLYGKSDTAAYNSHLAAGARCVEIDAWDNEQDPNEPKVTHGYTLTAHIPFRSVCRAIAEAMDKEINEAREKQQEPPLPIFISLECHCKADGQRRLAAILQEELGEKLVTERVHQGDDAAHVKLAELAGRVLAMVEFYAADDELEARAEKGDGEAAKRIKIIPELQALGVYAQSMKPRNDEWMKPNGVLEEQVRQRLLVNMEERAVLDLIRKDRAEELSKANANHLLRVYPKGTRISSLNMSPVPHWGVGAHVVALNWQALDFAMQLNGALFAGTNGYVLKPPHLRRGGPPRPMGRSTVKLEVAGCTDLPKPPKREDDIKPYVTCSLYTPSQMGGKPQKRKTHHYRKHLHKVLMHTDQPEVTSPIWDPPQELEWTYEDDELAFLRLLVKSDDAFARNPAFCAAAVRLASVPRDQWFFLRLVDMGGAPTKATMLVRFRFAKED